LQADHLYGVKVRIPDQVSAKPPSPKEKKLFSPLLPQKSISLISTHRLHLSTSTLNLPMTDAFLPRLLESKFHIAMKV
jgi:hypothetical protein